jgi:hypothetical protein
MLFLVVQWLVPVVSFINYVPREQKGGKKRSLLRFSNGTMTLASINFSYQFAL